MDDFEKRRLDAIRKAQQRRKDSIKDAKLKQNALIIGGVALMVGVVFLGKMLMQGGNEPAFQPQSQRQWNPPEPITLSKDVAVKKKLQEKRERESKPVTEKNYTVEDEPLTPAMVAESKEMILSESDEEIEFFRERLKKDEIKNNPERKARVEDLLERALKQREWYEKIEPNNERTWGYFDK